MAREPSGRYASAQELADDLGRFLEDRPIRARRPTIPDRLLKWSRRHRPLMAAAAVLAAIALVALAAGSLVILQEQAETRRALARATAHLSRAENEQRRAENAERDATEKLWRSYLGQAGARRRSRRIGQRFETLAALGQASRIARSIGVSDEDWLALRNEAIAALLLPDLRPLHRWPIPPGDGGVAFDADLERCAVGDPDGTIRICSAVDGRELARLPGHGPTALGIPRRFSGDGRHLAALYGLDASAGLRLWDLRRGEAVHKDPAARACAFSRDGSLLATVRQDGAVRIVDAATGDIRTTLPTRAMTYNLAFDPTASRLALVSADRQAVEIWDLESASLTRTLSHRGWIRALAWRGDGQFLVTGCDDLRIHLWDVSTGEAYAELAGHQGAIVGVAYFPDDSLILSWSWDGTMRLWEPARGTTLLSWDGGGPFWLSTDGTRLLFAQENEFVACDLASGAECRTLAICRGARDDVQGIGIDPANRLLACAGTDGLHLWDLSMNREVAHLPIGYTRSAAFLPDGALVTYGRVGLMRWPIEPRGEALELGPPESLGLMPETTPWTVAATNRSGDRIAAIGSPVRAVVLDARQPGRQTELRGHSNLASIAISPDGKWIATATWHSNGVRIWDADLGTPLPDLWSDSRSAEVRFSPDGHWLVASNGLEYRFWTVGSWQLERRVRRHSGGDAPGPIAFSDNDGARLVAIARSRSVIDLIELYSGRAVATLEAPDSAQVTSLQFSHDGRCLLATSSTTTRVWDLAAIGGQLGELELDWDPGPTESPPESPTDALRIDIQWGELPTVLLARAAEHERRKELDRAIEDYTRVIELEPGRVEAYEGLARVHRRLRDHAGAITDYEKVVAIDPRRAGAANSLAWMYSVGPDHLRNSERALALARQAVRLVPTDWNYLNTLGVAHYRAENLEQAIETLEQASRLNPTGATAQDLFFLAMSHWRLGHVDEARDLYGQAIARWTAQADLPVHWSEEIALFRAEADRLMNAPSSPDAESSSAR